MIKCSSERAIKCTFSMNSQQKSELIEQAFMLAAHSFLLWRAYIQQILMTDEICIFLLTRSNAHSMTITACRVVWFFLPLLSLLLPLRTLPSFATFIDRVEPASCAPFDNFFFMHTQTSSFDCQWINNFVFISWRQSLWGKMSERENKVLTIFYIPS